MGSSRSRNARQSHMRQSTDCFERQVVRGSRQIEYGNSEERVVIQQDRSHNDTVVTGFIQTENPVTTVIQLHYDFLVDRMSPEFGLIDKLYSNETLTKRQKSEIEAESVIEKGNEILLKHIVQANASMNLFETLKECDQSHLIMYLEANGVYRPYIGGNWPLEEREIKTLITNYETLVDILDCAGLVELLYETGVLNKRQRNLIESKVTDEEKNKVLLEILRKGSLDGYWQTIRCLHASNQSHIAEIFEAGGVVVRIDVNQRPQRLSNLSEDEKSIATKITNLLQDRTNSDANRIVERALQDHHGLNLVGAAAKHSVSLYFLCSHLCDIDRLEQMASDGQLRKFVEDLFNCLMSFPKSIRVTLKWSRHRFSKSRNYLQAILARCSIYEPRKLTIEYLPLELLDTILQSAYLLSRMRSGVVDGYKDSNSIVFLASVKALWFLIILRRRFKMRIRLQLKRIYRKEFEMYLSVRGCLHYLEEAMLVTEVSLTRQDLLAADFLTDLQIAKQQRKIITTDTSRRRRSELLDPRAEELLGIRRGIEEENAYTNLIHYLHRTNQALAAKVLKMGGAAVKLEIRKPKNSKRDAWSREFSSRLNKLKDRNQFKSADNEKIIQQLKDSDLEILGSFVNRDVIVWIWCKSPSAAETLKELYKSQTLIDHLYQLADENDRNRSDNDIHLEEFYQIKVNTKTWKLNDDIRLHHGLLVDLMSPEFGLIEKLCLNGTISKSQTDEIEAEPVIKKRNEVLLKFVLEKNAGVELLEALTYCDQSHLVQYMKEDGVYRPEFGGNWPLMEKERAILLKNFENLVDILDSRELVGLLYEAGALNIRQRNIIFSKTTIYEQNIALLEILRKGSLDCYRDTIRCLHDSKQSHVARIFELEDIVIRIDAKQPQDMPKVTEKENSSTPKIFDLLPIGPDSVVSRVLEKLKLNLGIGTNRSIVKPIKTKSRSGVRSSKSKTKAKNKKNRQDDKSDKTEEPIPCTQ